MFTEYIDFKIDDFKLRMVKGLSASLGKMLSILLLLGIGLVGLLVLVFCCILFLGEAMGSYAYAALSVAGGLLVVMVVLFLLRNKLFQNMLVRIFAGQLTDGKGDRLSSVRTMQDVKTAITMNDRSARRIGISASSKPLQKILIFGLKLLRRRFLRR